MRKGLCKNVVALALIYATGLGLMHSLSAAAVTRSVCTSAELQSAVNAANPGDIVELCAGTWTDPRVSVTRSGTQSEPIVIRAEVPGKTVFTGNARIEIGGEYLVVDGLVFKGVYEGAEKEVIDFRASGKQCRSCRVTNVVFDAFNPVDKSREVQWIRIRGIGHRVDHSYFAGKLDQGRMVTLVRHDNSLNKLRVDHNLFTNRPVENPGVALAIGTTGEFADSEAGATVERNLFFDANGREGEIISNKSSGNTYTGNVFKASTGALALRQGNGVTVDGNYFFGESKARTGGVQVYGDNHVIINNIFVDINPELHHVSGAVVLHNGDAVPDARRGWYHHRPARNTTIAWNTIVRAGEPIAFGPGDGVLKPSGIRIANNIFDTPVGTVLRLLIPLPGDTWSGGNIYEGNLGLASLAGFLKADPRLVKDASGVYRPSSGSPAINSAVSVSGVAAVLDIDKESRSGSRDVGADESSTLRLAPVGECDVGPETFKYGLSSNCSIADRPMPPTNVTAGL